MANQKQLIKILLPLFIFINVLSANQYEDWLKIQGKQYNTYKKSIDDQYNAYKKAQKEAFNDYKKDILKKWPKAEISTKHKWVEYGNDYKEKKVVDYQKEKISFEVIAKTPKEARFKIFNMFNKLATYTVDKASKNDLLEKKIAKKLKKKRKITKNNQALISDILTKYQKREILKKLIKIKLNTIKFKDKTIFKLNVKLPANSTLKKASSFKTKVIDQSKKLNVPAELIFAIMHSESSFNPMAKSYIPAFGLMQIVPKTAGVDTYRYLYKKRKLLSSDYLYNSNNNITIGSTYLKILDSRYLKRITNSQSRLYCTIAAYNTGAGNVSRAFNGTTNINKAAKIINNMSSKEVYKRLMRKLPHNETKKYLKKVTDRMYAYNKLLTSGKL